MVRKRNSRVQPTSLMSSLLKIAAFAPVVLGLLCPSRRVGHLACVRADVAGNTIGRVIALAVILDRLSVLVILGFHRSHPLFAGRKNLTRWAMVPTRRRIGLRWSPGAFADSGAMASAHGSSSSPRRFVFELDANCHRSSGTIRRVWVPVAPFRLRYLGLLSAESSPVCDLMISEDWHRFTKTEFRSVSL
jgi:hypothetical protein